MVRQTRREQRAGGDQGVTIKRVITPSAAPNTHKLTPVRCPAASLVTTAVPHSLTRVTSAARQLHLGGGLPQHQLPGQLQLLAARQRGRGACVSNPQRPREFQRILRR